MKTFKMHFDRAWPGHPVNLASGETITASNADGCELLRLDDEQWIHAEMPYTAPAGCLVRIDCVTFTAPFDVLVSIEESQ